MSSIDPFKLLNVSRTFTLPELREQYKRIALQVHPDKGGSNELFQLVTHSYKKLLKYYNKKIEKNWDDLREEAREEARRHMEPVQSKSMDKFNHVFEEQRIRGAYDVGYGDRMAASSAAREDIEVPPPAKGFKLKNFNKAFEKHAATTAPTTKIQVYKPPEPTPVSKTLAYSELGVDRVKDFSGDNESLKRLNYMDYMAAHSTTRLIDPAQVKQRAEYKSVEDLETHRSQRPQFTKEDERAYERQLEREAARERRRLETLSRQDQAYAEQHARINMALMGAQQDNALPWQQRS